MYYIINERNSKKQLQNSKNCGISNLPYTAKVTGYESMEDVEKIVNDIT